MVFMEKMRMKFFLDDPQVEETLTSEGKEEVKKENMRKRKVKMDEIREENERLKLQLSQVMEDYRSLKKQVKGSGKTQDETSREEEGDGDDPSEFVSLSLGRSPVNNAVMEEKKTKKKFEGENPDGLELGLDCKFHNLDNSVDEISLKNESGEKGCDEGSATPDSPRNSRNGDDEILRNTSTLKKPRVSVRAFCNTQTMNDGCQWRKYGQKVAKGNPCPRAYYRCTIATSCPVRKQVQRCANDMTILTTTYEGTHNHPLPPAATTMASTTSAAVAMLNCTSSSSSSTTTTTSPPPPPGLPNLTSQFPNITVSTTQSHPTVILDLTTPNRYSTPHKFPSLSSSSSLFSNVLSSTNSLNFSTPNSYFNPNDNTFTRKVSSSSSLLSSPSSSLFCPQPFCFGQIAGTSDEKLAAATKAITENPSFQSALAAAITSFVGGKVDQGWKSPSGLDFQLSFSQSLESNVRASSYGDMLLKR